MVIKGKIPVTWSNEWQSFGWVETLMTNEIPKDDAWDTPATIKKLKLEKLYSDLKISPECTKHFMCICPELSTGLIKILDKFNTANYNYNFLKVTAGHNVIKHYDSYATFIKFNNVSESEHRHIKRTIVMMTEWKFGQVLQVEEKIETHWNIGDTYTWEGDVWHGLGNFGFDDCVVMQITWL